MDASLFDRIAQTVGTRSRRGALKTMLGGAAVAAGMRTSLTGDAKKKRKKCKKKCPTCVPKEPGAACARTSECCGAQTNRVCANAIGHSQHVCCGTAGAACAADGDCCFDFECFEDTCRIGT